MFFSYVLKPLEWAGLISVLEVEGGSRGDWMYFKTPLWGEVLRLDTEEMVTLTVRH